MILDLNKYEKTIVCSALDAYKMMTADFMVTEAEQEARIGCVCIIEIIDQLKGKINKGEN